MAETLLDRRLGTASLVVELDGQPIALDQLGQVAIRHGRTKADGQPDASSCTLTTNAGLVPQVGQVLTVDAGADALAAFGAAPAAARRFTGRVTDAKLTPEPGTSSARRRCQVTATSDRARLGRQLVGDVPWPAELDGARVSRLLALASGITVGTVDSGTVQLRARDVDRQPLLQLLDQAANDAEGILAQHRDGTFVYHDADHRQLVVPDVELDAGDVLWPLTWTQDLSGMVNDLTVGYGSAEPQAETRFTDPQAIATHGLYAAKIATQLDALADAEALAQLTVARRARPWWDLDTMAVELCRAVDGGLHPLAAELLALELSDLVRVIGFPTAGPENLARLWVEGWSETITPASWRLVLAVSPWGRTGPAARWVDLDAALTWAELDPALSWAGIASWDPGTEPDSTWAGAPSDLTWAELTTTWAAWPY